MEVEYSEPQCVPKDRRPDALGDLRVLPDEILCAMLVCLTPRDVARLSCVSSVMYILCNEEPLWMSLCLDNVNGQLQYRGSWKKTALDQLHLPSEYQETCINPMHFDGFNSLFLLRRHYRCYTTLAGFTFDSGNVERKKNISLEDFRQEFDAKKPVLLSGLADTWPARSTWTIDQLLLNYGDTEFKISQRSTRKISVKFKDYVSYMQIQHDEDPLYIFDDKFGEVVPGLLKDYSVPHLFQEDFFDVLDRDKRPAFRWLIIGPERSGASWHVDPALTSAWNTLLSGRKRWALYPPGRVPLGVTVHVNEEDGDVNVETPSSLQWWLDFYPLLANEDKPIECTQLPGETIFVPSGWWHCVLNLETTVAVTQNFVNSANFEFVCLDMAPGYQHKGVCRAGLLALNEGSFEDSKKTTLSTEDSLSDSDQTRKEKRIKFCEPVEEPNSENAVNSTSINHNLHDQEFSYDINFLEMFLDKGRDHYNSLWSSSNCIGQRELREWLWKLWIAKPGLRNLIWKGACLSLNAEKWSECVREICTFHELPFPTDDERFPVGMGSNPVYLIADHVIKLYVEDGLEFSLHALGTELEFYSLLCKVDSPLKNHIPGVLASGILFIENGSYKIVPWDGKGVPNVIASCNLIPENSLEVDFPFGIWSKKKFEIKKAGMSINELISSGDGSRIWPYIVTKRCKGKAFAELRETLSWEDTLYLASFLGEQPRKNTSYSNLPPESRWWLQLQQQQLQPNYGRQTTLTNEQLNTLEGEMETFQAGVLKSTVKPSEVHDGSHIDDHSEPSLDACYRTSTTCMKKDLEVEKKELKTVYSKSAQEPLKPDNMGEYYELLDIDPVGCSVSKQPNELGFDSDSPWIGGEKTEPWWRMADRGELASLVAQRSLDLIENCDLPRPQSKHVKREDPYAYLGNFDRDGILPSSKDFKVQTGNALSNRTVRSACGKQWTLSEEQPQYGLDKQNSDGPAHNGMNEAQFSDTDSSKAQLLEALRHSQTRAREAEKAAKQAYAEKEHVLKLFFKQASHLFAYKQWLQLLEFENLFFQIKNNNQPTSTLFPVVLPWMMPNKSWKLPKRCQKPAKVKRGKRGRPRRCISKFAVAFAVSLSLVGAGLILGWTVGWMLPTF